MIEESAEKKMLTFFMQRKSISLGQENFLMDYILPPLSEVFHSAAVLPLASPGQKCEVSSEELCCLPL